jgi:hypothetical protein
MLNPYTPETKKSIDMHRDELLQDATKYRLLRQIRAQRAQLWRQRIQIGLGNLLIAVGTRLQEPYRLATVSEPKVF